MYNKRLGDIYFTAFDFETTGLYPDKDKIIEIGAVKYNLSGERYVFSGLINPEMSIPEAASNVNGISDNMVADKPLMKDILPDFIDFIDGTVLVAHNIGFDAAFLMFAIDFLGFKIDNLVCIDTIILAKHFFKGFRSYKLGNIAKNIGIDLTNAHRAEDDAVACMELFLKCIDSIPDKENIELRQLMKISGHRKKTLADSKRNR
ncbi:MAG: 3'-5' exonuclease [Spirochaetales bacterium]|nr:3'-5' exonuclease [Spirochaetales bacterium]